MATLLRLGLEIRYDMVDKRSRKVSEFQGNKWAKFMCNITNSWHLRTARTVGHQKILKSTFQI